MKYGCCMAACLNAKRKHNTNGTICVWRAIRFVSIPTSTTSLHSIKTTFFVFFEKNNSFCFFFPFFMTRTTLHIIAAYAQDSTYASNNVAIWTHGEKSESERYLTYWTVRILSFETRISLSMFIWFFLLQRRANISFLWTIQQHSENLAPASNTKQCAHAVLGDGLQCGRFAIGKVRSGENNKNTISRVSLCIAIVQISCEYMRPCRSEATHKRTNWLDGKCIA